MNIGYLDRRITLELRGSNLNAYGEPDDSWSSVGTVWAAMDNSASKARNMQDLEQDVTRNVVTWRVRSSTLTRQVTPKYRVNYGGEYYNILAVQERGRKDEIRLITERVVSE